MFDCGHNIEIGDDEVSKQAFDRYGRPLAVGEFVKDDRGRVYRFGGFDSAGFAVGLRWVSSRKAFATAQASVMTPLAFCVSVDDPRPCDLCNDGADWRTCTHR